MGEEGSHVLGITWIQAEAAKNSQGAIYRQDCKQGRKCDQIRHFFTRLQRASGTKQSGREICLTEQTANIEAFQAVHVDTSCVHNKGAQSSYNNEKTYD